MNFSNESIKSYMRSIASIPLVPVEEEKELAGLISEGSAEARETLIVGNLRLVVKIAHNFKSLGIPLSDLISEGNIGLMKAVEKFKPDKGAKFSSYAAWWIKQSMRRAIANQSRVIRIPVQSAAKINKIQKISLVLAEKLGRIPTEQEIADELGITIRSINTLKSTASAGIVSLNAMFQEGGDEGTLNDVLADMSQFSPDQELDAAEVKKLLRDVINNKLKEREKLIIMLRYGMNGEEPKTLEEVSDIVGRTRERVRQIQHQALRKIGFAFKEEDGTP